MKAFPWKSLSVALMLGVGGLSLTLQGCSEKEGEGDAGGLTGEVLIDGSSTVFPISEGIAEEFEKTSEIKVKVGVSGTGGGFKRFTKGETDISDASRPIKKEEHDACVENKIEYIELPVAYDGLTIAVNIENDFVDQLTVDDLKKIYLADAPAKTWNEVKDGWPETPITVFAPGTDSGTFDYFKEVVAGKEGAMRGDMSASEDDNVLVTGVAGDKGAIGFFGASYYFTNKDKLKAVPIINSAGEAVVPSPESIESGEYNPFSRPLFIYVNAESAKKPHIKKFVAYYLENAPKTAEQVKYVPLPKSIYESAKKHFEESLTGTHYLDEEGNKRSGSLAEIYGKDSLHKSE